MDYAVDYAKEKGLAQKELKHINFARLKKEMHLLCELVGVSSRIVTTTHEEVEARSQMQ